MLHVFQSDQVEDLVATLVYNLERRAASLDGVGRTFRRVRVVVPNQNLGTYLQFQIAARKGVAANLSFETMEAFLESLIPEPLAGEAPVEVVSTVAIRTALLGLLQEEELLSAGPMEPLRRFLERASDDDGLQRRRYQLASRLASIFREYGYSRIEMLQAWRRGELVLQGEEEIRETEQWQQKLWYALFGEQGLLEELSRREGRELLALTDIPERFGHGMAGEGRLEFPEAVHFFGFSFLPEFFFRLFSPFRGPEREELIELYVMAPCLEVWDDLQTTDPEDEPPWEASPDSELFTPQESPLALRLWGRPGRDFHRQLLQLTDGDLTQPEVIERQEYTLLQRLQAVIRHRRDVREYAEEKRLSAGEPGDRKSLRFFSSPGVQRECEIIASEIWELLRVHPTLRFNDIAVVVQPRQRGIYQTHLRAAFEQTHRIPHNVIDIDGTRSSPALEAVRLLLELPLGKFRRREMLSLLIHPCVQERFAEGDGAQWMEWCDKLNIFHGVDEGDHQGTYLEGSNRYTWDQGLKRLVLGAFMASDPLEESDTVLLQENEDYLPLEVGRDGLDCAATLVMVARELLVGARRSQWEERSLKEWMEQFQGMISRYVAPLDDRDSRALLRLQGKLNEIGAADFREAPVGYRTAFEFALTELSALEEQYGQYLADGVVVSSFRPMRPIPFKVVFVAGLDEGQFPLPEPMDPLDLRNATRQIGDVRRREQDRYMFLETLMSTRARLYLSWVGRDETSGEHREPASVVRELQEMVALLEPPAALEAREVVHPLRRHDSRYFPELAGENLAADGENDDRDVPGEKAASIDASRGDHIPPRSQYRRFGEKDRPMPERIWPNHHREARREAAVVKMRANLERALAHQGLEGYHPTLEELREALGDQRFRPLAKALSFTSPQMGEEMGYGAVVDVNKGVGPSLGGTSSSDLSRHPWLEEGRIVLRLRDVSAFLDSPIQGAARVLMRIFDGSDEDLLDVDDEPFEAPFLDRLSLARGVFDRILKEEQFLAEEISVLVDEAYGSAEKEGRLPSGLFLDVEKARCTELLRAWGTNWLSVREELPDLRKLSRTVEFRSPGESTTPGNEEREYTSLEIPVNLGGEEVIVELRGEVQVFGDQVSASLQTSMSKGKGKLKYMTRAAIEEVALRAAGESKGPIYAITLPSREQSNIKSLIREVYVDSPQEARAYLADVLADLLGGVHDYFLPVDVVDEALSAYSSREDGEFSLRDYAREIRDRDPRSLWYSAPRTAYGPIKSWRKIEPPEEKQAWEIIARRFRIFAEMNLGQEEDR